MDTIVQIKPERKPEWLKVKAPGGENFREVKTLLRKYSLNTVCESALCPNIGHCFERRTATFLIMGNVCTRNCGFCHIETGKPLQLNHIEPRQVALASKILGLKHVVVTSVNRDELKDGGSAHFAQTIREIRTICGNDIIIEVLIPDFRGDLEALRNVVLAHPQILNHNVETVQRLYRTVRPGAIYERSLELLRKTKEMDSEITTKSGMMLGLGESKEEVIQVMKDLRKVGCDILTVGQYLRPSLENLPVVEYIHPQVFEEIERIGKKLGFKFVASGPLVRSSFHAEEVYNDFRD